MIHLLSEDSVDSVCYSPLEGESSDVTVIRISGKLVWFMVNWNIYGTRKTTDSDAWIVL
jgi:hypothetical protein